MNEKILKIFKDTRKFLGKHSPIILTGIGITGLLSTTVLAVKATPMAEVLINDKKRELDTDKLSPIEIVKAAWKPYIPAAGMAIIGVSCIVGASAIHYKRNAALATVYAISERTLNKYREKVIETLGEKKEKDIRNEISQDNVVNDKISDGTIIITPKGNTLFKDTMSGRYFRSDTETIKSIINKMNRRLTYEHYISLNELYGELGLDNIKNGNLIGWNLDTGLIEIKYDTCLTENDEPCIVLDYMVGPKYDYDKLL